MLCWRAQRKYVLTTRKTFSFPFLFVLSAPLFSRTFRGHRFTLKYFHLRGTHGEQFGLAT